MSLLSEIGKDISLLVFPNTFSKNQCTFISIISYRLVKSLLNLGLGLGRFIEQTVWEKKNHSLNCSVFNHTQTCCIMLFWISPYPYVGWSLHLLTDLENIHLLIDSRLNWMQSEPASAWMFPHCPNLASQGHLPLTTLVLLLLVFFFVLTAII